VKKENKIKTLKKKDNTKNKLKDERLKRLEAQLKSNILKRKQVKNNNG
tara:strand:- start:422 stop:565 length:144 start_codon:yes stop_codon:yes gene_type:complete